MNMRYFQTWHYIARIRPCFIKCFIQFLCGLRGHELSKTEYGYGGGMYIDRWCRWCNKLIQIPYVEVDIPIWLKNEMPHVIGYKKY